MFFGVTCLSISAKTKWLTKFNTCCHERRRASSCKRRCRCVKAAASRSRCCSRTRLIRHSSCSTSRRVRVLYRRSISIRSLPISFRQRAASWSFAWPTSTSRMRSTCDYYSEVWQRIPTTKHQLAIMLQMGVLDWIYLQTRMKQKGIAARIWSTSATNCVVYMMISSFHSFTATVQLKLKF